IAVAPRIARLAAGAQRVFEFGFARQAVVLAGVRRQPIGVGLRVVPRHVYDRQIVGRGNGEIVLTPGRPAAVDHASGVFLVDARRAEFLGVGRVVGVIGEAAELGDGDVVAAQGEAGGDLDLAHGLFGGAMTVLRS